MQSRKNRMQQTLRALLALCAVSSVAICANAQQTSRHALDVGVNYTYIHTNLLPGCDCFSLNGGEATVQVGLVSHWAAVADFTGTTRSGITADNYRLTQLTYTAGARYWPLPRVARYQPFGEALFGGAHASGTLSPGNNAIGGSNNSAAFQIGGGLSVQLGSRLQLTPVQADYLLTTFHNNDANHQNQLRLAAGLTIRLRR